MLRAVQVRIHRRQVGEREYDAITVLIADLNLSCDLVCDRQIRLAHELAIQHQATFMYDDANAERVKTALAARSREPMLAHPDMWRESKQSD